MLLNISSFYCTAWTILTSLYSLGTDPMENRSIAQQRMFCCHAHLSGQVFIACCIATSTGWTHREHCFCCVFVAVCLLRCCLAKEAVRHIAPSLRLFIPNSLKATAFFYSKGCAWFHHLVARFFLR
jgi:hypothetical protein